MGDIAVKEVVVFFGIALVLAVILAWAYVQYLQSTGRIKPRVPPPEGGPPQELGLEADEGQ